ncbi:N,N'-diacetylchitobiose transport system permease protein [Micrococcales bacterium KH10]|nr:N,N'-diacetylchitobiose transport system permease protein [Micrococcales bacterium KH10]
MTAIEVTRDAPEPVTRTTKAAVSATAVPRAKNRRKIRPGKVVISLLGIAAALVWVFPVYWMIISAFTPNARLQSTNPSFFPTSATWSGFTNVISGSGFVGALRMSLAITVLTVLVVIIWATLAALAISRFKFKGRKSFLLAVLFIQMLPAEGLFLAQYQMLSKAQLVNTIWGVSIIYIAAIIPFTVWMLRGFVAGVPAELEEAAMVDGLTRSKAFFKITFPLLAPGLIASGVYAFLQAWNEFTVALIALPARDAQTLPIWLRSFLADSANKGIDWSQVMAASTLIAIPVIIFFLIVQGRMTSGLVSGAVKG